MSKKTVDLASASTQHKERETDVSSTNSGTPVSDNEDESATSANLKNRTK